MRHSRLNGLNAGEKYVYSKECRGVYLFFFFPVRLSLSNKRSKTLNFSKDRRGAYLLSYLQDAKENSGGAVLIKCFFSSCVVPESVVFVSWSVCARVIFGAGSRGRGLWGCIKGLLIKNSRTVPWRETYLGKI